MDGGVAVLLLCLCGLFKDIHGQGKLQLASSSLSDQAKPAWQGPANRCSLSSMTFIMQQVPVLMET